MKVILKSHNGESFWILRKNDDIGLVYYQCNRCGKGVEIDGIKIHQYKFCPHCGALMKVDYK